MNSKITEQLGTMPVGRLFVKLAIPTVLAQIIFILYNIVDRIYLGRIATDGGLALTGVGLCLPIVTIINAFAMLIGQGGAPRSSICLGEGDHEKAEKYLGNCVVLVVAFAVMITAAIWLFGEDLLWIFGASENTIVYALPYIKIYGSGAIFVMIALGMNLFITSQGNTKYGMFTVVLGALCNIVLDPILIFACHLGVVGAAIATVFSQFLSALFVVTYLFGKKTALKVRAKYLKLEKKLIADILSLGVSPFIMMATEAAISMSFNLSLQKYGGDIAVGTMTICATIMQMIFVPANGVAQGAQPIISYNYGAKNKDRFLKMVKLLMVTCLILTLVLVGLAEIFPHLLAGMFGAKDGILEMCKWAMRVYLAASALFGIQVCVQQTYVATGQAKISLFIACLRKVILLIPFIFIFPLFIENKVLAVFLAEPAADIISVIAAAISFAIIIPRMLKTHFVNDESEAEPEAANN